MKWWRRSMCIPTFEQSVVVAREVTPGDTRLIGYFVPVPQSQLTLGELRNFLEARLPDFMVPAKFVRLEKLPLIDNGKVDRMSLPPADDTNTLRDNACAAPRTDMEKTVAAMLARLLELEYVDAERQLFLTRRAFALGSTTRCPGARHIRN